VLLPTPPPEGRHRVHPPRGAGGSRPRQRHAHAPHAARAMKHAAHITVALAALFAVAACNARDEPFARAFRADSPSQLIGGDVGMARVGDFIIENDRVRIAVLDTESSPAPGVFGGTFVDADLQRPEAQYRGGTGHDQLAEVIPFANL